MRFTFIHIALALTLTFTGCAYNPNSPAARRASGFNQLRIGMPQHQAVALAGQPIRVNQIVTASGISQQYMYSSSQFLTPGQQFLTGMQEGVDGVSRQRATYLYFQNGRLTAIQN